MTIALRVAWLLIAALPEAVSSSSASPVGPWLVWAVWTLVALAVLILHPLSLVVVRLLAPLSTLHMAVEVVGSRASWGLVTGLVLALGVSVASFAGRYGFAHAQAAAYGHERRHLLRPPIAVIAPIALVWIVVAILAALVIHGERLVVSLGASIPFAALLAFLLRRAHVLTRRWLVFVPAGIAVHDPLLLRDTFMVRGHDVRGLNQRDPMTEAFDATGTTWGTSLTLTLSHPHDVSLSPFGARLAGTLDRLHVTALLVAPSRPEAALADASNAAVNQPLRGDAAG